MATIAVVGPGAIGGVVTAWLHQAGAGPVVVCARRPLERLRVTMQGGLVVEPGIEVLTDPVVAPSVDWALVCTKTYDAGAAGRWLERLCGGGGRAAILQNGVEHRERFAGIVLPERLVPVIVDCPAERDSPTQVRQCGPGRMTVADDAGGRAFAALFSGSTADVVTTPDLKTAAWRKLCINAAGVVSALTLKPNGVMRDEAIGEVVRGIVREVIAVGRAEGAVLDEHLVEDVLAGGRRAPAGGVNSIFADRLAGRRTEIDARNGVVVRLGRKHGIATPCNAMAVALIEAQS
jgi:2-dehydropantoate 2-reductase